MPKQLNDNFSSYHLYPIRVSNKKGGISQNQMYCLLRENQIGVNLHYIPIYRQPYFKSLGFHKGYCNQAELHFKEEISLPIFQNLKEIQQEYIIEKITKCLKEI